MNKVFFIGNLTRDPELNETPSGIAVCKFSLAVNRQHKTQDGETQTDFFNCTAWRGAGETIAKYAKKGNKLFVEGELQTRSYEDPEGNKRNALDVVVSDFEFLTPKSATEAPESNAPAKTANKPAAKTAAKNKRKSADIDDDDQPF